MPFTRDQIRESVQRAGDAHWQALIRHHEDAYPASRPTPGDVATAEAERLNAMGLGDRPDLSWSKPGSNGCPPPPHHPRFRIHSAQGSDCSPSRTLVTSDLARSPGLPGRS